MQFFNNLNKTKALLFSANILLVFFLILLSNLKVIPLRAGDFIFFALLTLALALYRPGWAFLFFAGSIALENINLAPESLGIAVRPYQFFGALAILAILFRFASKKLYFEIVKPKWYDWLLVGMAGAGFLSALGASDKGMSLKFSIILASFVALYFLVKNYIQNSEDLKRVLPFFLSSGAIVVLYGIWQNIRFLGGLSNFEVMPGRPNATFLEADWLGMYLVLLISVIYALSYYFQSRAEDDPEKIINHQPPTANKFSNHFPWIVLFLFLIFCFILLILTVSRSAWLGALAVTFIHLFAGFTQLRFHPKGWQWKGTIKTKLSILFSLLIALGTVHVFHLTNFQLFNRAASTGTGMQKITISCQGDIAKVPEVIERADDLERYGCRHINLEEIEKERIANNIVTEIYRKDPNINVRAQIYQKTWQEIKRNPVLGIGWGNIGSILGSDGRGATLNSSNIFLEIWLGSGIIGLVCFIVLLFHILFSATRRFFHSRDINQKSLNLFIISSWFGVIVFNLFNAGIFLAILWMWLGVSNVKSEE